MSDNPQKIALALEPQKETFGLVPLMIILVEDLGWGSWLEAKEFVFDLKDVAPQVVWVDAGQQDEFELKLAAMEIGARVVSSEEAERIRIKNKPVRGTIDLQIRTRYSEINPEMIKDLKAKKLISGCRMGDNANEIFHWKDDRWYQDFHLTLFKESDVAQIEQLIGDHGYIVVDSSN